MEAMAVKFSSVLNEAGARMRDVSTSLHLHYIIFYYSRVDIIDPGCRIMESTIGYTFTPCVGFFTSPGTDTR